ncbi:LytTR family DNA-binding domain-containing protein [Puniceibacterium confluentis]|uniref:LytTR family DNA-binding domain-containing protein n=1 Tax=Puniceibacterium confluentis TaxID=1958944 RepID=UPI003561CF23
MQPFYQTLSLRALLGDRFELSLQSLIALLMTPKSAIFFTLALSVLMTADAPGVSVSLDTWMLAIVWPVAAATYLFSYLAIFWLVALVQLRIPKITWPLPVAAILAVLPAAAAAEGVTWLLMRGQFQSDIWTHSFYFAPTILAFDTVFYGFVVPVLQAASPPADTGGTPSETVAPEKTARHLQIGQHSVDIAKVRYIQARQHHVHVTLNGTTLSQRARLSDIVAQTRAADGVQPHRSWWVARSEAKGIARNENRHVLTLADNTQIPIARTRLDSVEKWLDAHLSEQRDSEAG